MTNKGKECVEKCSYLESMLTKDQKCKTGNGTRSAMAKDVFNGKKVLFCGSMNLVIRKNCKVLCVECTVKWIDSVGTINILKNKNKQNAWSTVQKKKGM